MPDRVARRLEEQQAARDLGVAGDRPEARAVVVPRAVGVAEALERLTVPRLLELLLVHDDRGLAEVLVAPDVVEMEMGVDECLDVAGLVPAGAELSRDRLLGRLLGQ